MKHSPSLATEDILRSNGLKNTPLRVALLDFLAQQETPLTAEEIGRSLKKVEFDRASLFRTLKTFTEAGILNMIDLGEGFHRYERNCELHHHHHHIHAHRHSHHPHTAIIIIIIIYHYKH